MRNIDKTAKQEYLQWEILKLAVSRSQKLPTLWVLARIYLYSVEYHFGLATLTSLLYVLYSMLGENPQMAASRPYLSYVSSLSFPFWQEIYTVHLCDFHKAHPSLPPSLDLWSATATRLPITPKGGDMPN